MAAKDASPYAGVKFNTSNLARERERGTTNRAAAKEITDTAAAQGRDISRVPGGRRPTEVYKDGKWVRV